MSARTRGGGQRRRSRLPTTVLAIAAAVLLFLAVLAPTATTKAAPAPAPADPTFAPPFLPPVPSRSPAPTSAVPAPTEVAPVPTAAPTQSDPPLAATSATPPASQVPVSTASLSPAPVPTNNFGVRPSPQPTIAPTPQPQPQPTAAPTAAPSPTPAPSTTSSNQRAVSPPAGARQASDVPVSGDGTVLAVQDAAPAAAGNSNQTPSSATGNAPSDAPSASPGAPAPNAGDSTQTDSNNGATNGVTDAVATAPTGSGASSSSSSTASVVTPIVTTLGVIGAVGAVAAVAYQRVRRRRSAAAAADTASVYHPRTSPHASNAPSSTTPSLVNALSGAGTAPRRSYKLSLYGPPASASAMFASGAGPATSLPPLTPKSTQAIFQAPWYRAQPGADAADDDDDSTRAMPYARARIPDSEHRSASKGYAPPPAIAIPVLSAAPAALSPVPVSPMSPMSQRVPRLVNLDAARDRRMAESMWFDGDAEGDEDETRSWAGSARRRRSSAGTSPTVPMGPPAWAAVAEAARGLAEVDDDNESALSLTAALATLPAATASTSTPVFAAPAAEPGTTTSPRESLTPSENAPSSTFSFHPAGAAAASPPVLASPAPAIAGPAPRAGARRVAIPYAPSLDDELLLNLDDLVVVEHVYLDNWAVGHNLSTGQSGAFPVICLQ
ncbi:hypothetical protein AMAG_10201 [Allomyces macrogynus ATCC 38327]|uniref:SH3 domain-containing protein n=1 Tax=Allomyces macrogynus (strain ATCC 38327) TaxID=578462 RepID=A0A0L0SQQ1_ALLM3|nr:hypothetical protein AMAG_10201 [Allomyces macrogynus ATCC 38327]|eukprot:KNE64868.1 hypothetical protein AMAG_10201 [Allomyces macrogynus ATCC 38327]